MTLPSPEWVSAAGDAATGVAAVSALIIGWRGISAWRRELTGRHGFELARRILLALFRLRDAVEAVRNPFMSLSEIAIARKAAGLPEPATGGADSAGVIAAYRQRWRLVVEARSQAAAEVLEAQVVWGETWDGALRPFDDRHARLHAAMTRYLDALTATQQLALTREEIAEKYTVLYAEPQDDKFRAEYTDLIEQIAKQGLSAHLTDRR